MDKIIDKIAALGVPGLVLLVVTATTGFAGAAALTTALSTLGGPIGMIGGIGMLILIGLIAQALTKYGLEAIFKGVVDKIKREKNLSNKEIKEIIDGYWFLSQTMKDKLKDYVDRWGGKD